MKDLLTRASDIIHSLRQRDLDHLLYRNLPQLVMDIMTRYFRLEIEGVENIPRRGPAIITPNHSGYAGFDALMLAHEISKEIHRIPRVLTHHLWFLNQTTGATMRKLGFVEASYANAEKLLKKNNLIVLFPEGEQGNFKPTSKMYQLQDFRRGCVRLAIQENCPLVPTLIIGAEETHINLKQIHLPGPLANFPLPLPLNILPLPVKWKIVFLKPIYFPYGDWALDDRELMYELADDVRTQMQAALNDELKKRQSLFF